MRTLLTMAVFTVLGSTAQAAVYECKMGNSKIVKVEVKQVSGMDYVTFNDGSEEVKGFASVTTQLSSGHKVYSLTNANGSLHFFFPEIYTPKDQFGSCVQK